MDSSHIQEEFEAGGRCALSGSFVASNEAARDSAPRIPSSPIVFHYPNIISNEVCYGLVQLSPASSNDKKRRQAPTSLAGRVW